MRKMKKGTKVETAFKVDKSKKVEDSDEEDIDDLEANFVRKMKKGTSKYRGKLPLKCFSCGGIGHYASRCPKRYLNNKNKENKGKMIGKVY